MDYKKGLVYTICIFLICSALLELLAFYSEHQEKRRAVLQPYSGMEHINDRSAEMAIVAMQSMGLRANASRNSTHLALRIEDVGFPLANPGAGMAAMSPYKIFVEGEWANSTGLKYPLNMDLSLLNLSGIALQSNYKLNYTKNSSLPGRDNTTLYIPQNNTLTNFSLQIFCTRHANTSAVYYTGWSNTGVSAWANITHYDPVSGNYSSTTTFDPATDNSFTAYHNDSSGNWIQSIHVDLVRPNYTIMIWNEANLSYTPPAMKSNINCTWNLTVQTNYSSNATFELYVPINVNMTYQNSSWAGQLAVIKQ